MKNWGDFWQNNQSAFDGMMHHYTHFTARKLHEGKHILPTDAVLDIGCGPGRMADFFRGKCAQWVGLDISEHYVETCKQKFADEPTFSFAPLLPTDYLNFELLGDQKFDKIVVMSVIQYFKNTKEVEKLIAQAQHYLKPAGKIIIADIVLTENPLGSLWSVFGASVRYGFLPTFVRFVLYCRFSNYYKLRQEQHLLTLPPDTLQKIIDKHQLKASIVSNLTMDNTRKTLLIEG